MSLNDKSNALTQRPQRTGKGLPEDLTCDKFSVTFGSARSGMTREEASAIEQ